MSLRVDKTNGHALIQDLGRAGYGAIGIGTSGAWDRSALIAGNVLVGNPLGAAGLEVPMGGLTVRATRSLTVACTGARAPLHVDGQRVDFGARLQLAPGSVLDIGVPAWGARCYLAVTGGIAADPVLGSRSRDTLAGIGPAAVQQGDVLAVGERASDGAPTGGWHYVPQVHDDGVRGRVYLLDLEPGPRVDWFTESARRALFAGAYHVTDLADRVGIRLHGAELERAITQELPSEGVVAGALQVPGGGQPLIFGPDHPVTGGYPVIGVLTEAARDATAQLRPGDSVRFRRAGTWEA